MKKKGTFLLFCFFLLPFLAPIKAQPSFFVPNQVVDPGVFVNADIKVSSFSDIIGTQFSVAWDSTVLQFIGLQDFAMDITEQDNFGTNNASSGVIGFFWFDEAVSGVSLDDSTTLFSIKFEVTGNPSDSTFISFTDQPTQIEISDTSLQAIEANFIEGKILIDQMVSAQNTIPEWMNVENAFPNPFSNFTQIPFRIDRSIDTQIFIYNNQGQLVFKSQQHFTQGNHTLKLDKQIFPATGTYFIKMLSKDFIITQKLDFF
jgi:hypothetical protein